MTVATVQMLLTKVDARDCDQTLIYEYTGTKQGRQETEERTDLREGGSRL